MHLGPMSQYSCMSLGVYLLIFFKVAKVKSDYIEIIG